LHNYRKKLIIEGRSGLFHNHCVGPDVLRRNASGEDMRKEAAMPGSQDPRKTNEENRTFITEKIVKPPLTKGQIVIR
jgi:hypothetical protein